VICSERLVLYVTEQWKGIFLSFIHGCAEPLLRHSLAILYHF
jgi:hypothetical protein